MTVTWFGNVILISIYFYDFISSFTPQFQFRLRRYIKHSRQCFIIFPNTSKFVKNTPLRVVFSTLVSVFGNVMKHCLSCLIYYFRHRPRNTEITTTLLVIHLFLFHGQRVKRLDLLLNILIQEDTKARCNQIGSTSFSVGRESKPSLALTP